MLVTKINAGDANGVFQMFGPEMQKFLPLEKLSLFVFGVRSTYGELGTVEKKSETSFVVTGEKGKVDLLVVLVKGKIEGLRITPFVPEPAVVRTTLPLGLPFKGEWTVFWGGDKPEVNHHIGNPSQRRALDILKYGPDGKTFKNEGKALTDYFAYGQDVVAVADGTVLTVIDGVPDSVPGVLNPYAAIGNAVTIEHEGHVYSVYAHLVPNKIKVKVGAKVKRGDLLGQCGNSGNSSEPHIHFQVQDGPRFESAWGIELVFPSVKLAGAPAKDHVPVKGDKLSPE